MERVLALVTECRVVLRAPERPPKLGESSSVEAEQILYYTLMSAIDAGDDGGCGQGSTVAVLAPGALVAVARALGIE